MIVLWMLEEPNPRCRSYHSFKNFSSVDHSEMQQLRYYCQRLWSISSIIQGFKTKFNYCTLPEKTNGWIPKMMVWKSPLGSDRQEVSGVARGGRAPTEPCYMVVHL